MRKIICKKEYNTETASLIKKYTFSYWGDPAGFEESLYQTPEGFYFIYVNGGAESPYTEENITRLAKDKVSTWIENHK